MRPHLLLSLSPIDRLQHAHASCRSRHAHTGPKRTRSAAPDDTDGRLGLIFAPEDDPELEAASKRAQATFKYFWRTYSLDRNRVTPTIETARQSLTLQHHSRR